MEEVFAPCEIQQKRFYFIVGDKEQSQDVLQIFFHYIPQRRSFSSIVSHNPGVFLALYPTPQENLLCCIPQRRRFCSVVGYNREK
jgi:hypothetical protein